MSFDYSFRILENILMIKEYQNKNEVIETGALVTKIICNDQRVNDVIKSSYRSTMKRLDSLKFEEMQEIIEILRSNNQGENTSDDNTSDFNDGSSDFEIGVNCYKKKDFNRAFILFKRAAEVGNANAIYGYGLCLYYGIGTKADPVKAIKQFVSASDMGIRKADEMIQYVLK